MNKSDIESLEYTYPIIASEWHPFKNGTLSPSNVRPMSNKKVWWLGKCGHEWEAVIASRVTSKSSGCPYCANKRVLRGFNDLATTNPEVVAEWDFTKNDISPYEITRGSSKKAWWICSRGHSYESPIAGRTSSRKRGCPYCANQKLLIGFNDLETRSPKLASEWNTEKNGCVLPNSILAGGHKKVWWRCDQGHEWQDAIITRLSFNLGCPFCSGRYAVIGETDLETSKPLLASEWDDEKNGELTPQMVKAGSHKAVWWRCKVCGNSWKAFVSDRSRGNGCPTCNFANRTSEQEQILYYYLHAVFPDAINSFRPKWIGASSEIDIYIPSLKIGVEYDGCRWHRDIQKDIRKDALVDGKGITLFRLREVGCPILLSTSICIEVKISNNDKSYMLPAIRELINLINTKYDLSIVIPDFDLKRDRTRILASYEGNKKGKSLAIMSPSIAAEWNYDKNNGLIPDNMANQSNKKVWWRCGQCGYEWESTINNRIKRGCPACSNKVVWVGHNDISTTYPEMLAIWNYEKNGDKMPEAFTPGAEVEVWWKCKCCGYEWKAMIYHIKRSLDKNVKEVSCPACVGKAIWKGHNDLQSLRPDLASEWDYSKNEGLLPSEITLGSTKTIWWKCNNCGNEWHTSPYNRSKNGSNCPACARKQIRIKNGKPVRCIETGEVFSSAILAGKKIGRNGSAISFCLKDSKRTCVGFHWEYAEKIE